MSNKRHDKVCIVCHRPFIAKSLKRKYCSDICKQRRFIENKMVLPKVQEVERRLIETENRLQETKTVLSWMNKRLTEDEKLLSDDDFRKVQIHQLRILCSATGNDKNPDGTPMTDNDYEKVIAIYLQMGE